MAEIDPLALAGRTIDPSLTQRTVNSSKALDALRSSTALRQMMEAGAGERNAANILQKMQGLGVQYNLPDLAGTGSITDNTRGSLRKTRDTDDFAKRVPGLASLADTLGIRIPQKPGDTALTGTELDRPTSKGVPGKLKRAREQGLAGIKEQLKKKKKVERHKLGPGGLEKHTEEEERITTEKHRPVSNEQEQKLHASVTRALKAAGREFKTIKIIGETGTSVLVEIDGVPTTIPKKKRK